MHPRRLLKALLLLLLKKPRPPRPKLPKQRSLLVKSLPGHPRLKLKSRPKALLLLRMVLLLPQPPQFQDLIHPPRSVADPVCRLLVARNSGPS